MKSQSSQYRTKICGLPHKLAFSPKTSTSPSTDRENNDNCVGEDETQYQQQQEQMKLWKKQLLEEKIWKNAQIDTTCRLLQVQCLKIVSYRRKSEAFFTWNVFATGQHGLTLLLTSWLPWQDLGKILTKILPRF